jgi:serine/threonine-protein kinase RsbW
VTSDNSGPGRARIGLAGGDQTKDCTTVDLPFEPAAVGRARRMMTVELEHAGAPRGVIDDAALVLSELVTNGLKHGRPDGDKGIEVGWCLYDDRVLVCVCDGGTVGSLRPLELSTTAPTGRGLAIVDYVCDSWTVDRTGGTRITAEIAIAS